jgi:RHS repeat-associated protein
MKAGSFPQQGVSRMSPIQRVLGASLIAVILGAALLAAQNATPTVQDASAKDTAPAAAASKVRVNRTVPTVAPPTGSLALRDQPSLGDLVNARVFREPLVPVGGTPTDAENAALGRALLKFAKGVEGGSDIALRQFLVDHPASPWRASLLLNLGLRYRSINAYSRALASWDEAWKLANGADDGNGTAVANLAIAEWLVLNASLGQTDAVRGVLGQIAARPFSGPAAVKLGQARELIGMIAAHPDKVVSSGPQALLAVLQEQGLVAPPVVAAYRPTASGTSLTQLRDLAKAAGIDMRAVVRATATDAPVPSIVHWKVGHYSALVERNGNRYRIIDNGFGGTYWVTRDTLFDEASGYLLVPVGAELAGWHAVSDDAASLIVGRSCPPGGPPPSDPDKPCQCNKGMVGYSLHEVSASLHLGDIPIGYTPPRGPSVNFRLTYRQRELLQPQIFTFANLGPKWTSDWLRFVEEVPMDAFGVNPAHVWVYLEGGGREVFYNPDGSGVYPAHWRTKATLVKVTTSPIRYERRFPDGTIEVFTASDAAPAGQRRVFLTQIVDPRGQAVSLTWDAQFKLVAMTDAIGQVTTLAYDDATNPLRITKVTDPFGREAAFTYNASGQLETITDVIGLVSRLNYGSEDFVTTLTTPYGRTTFRRESTDNFVNRFVEATDPLGGTERIEFRWQTDALPTSLSATDVPTGFETANASLDYYNTVYWDKLAWSRAPNDLTAARITKWVVSAEMPGGAAYSAGVAHSVKRPLESRVWYLYPGQTSPANAGSFSQPTRTGRIMDDGASQIWQATYNSQGSVLTRTDPLGRQTTYDYATNGVDSLQIRQTTGWMNDLLASSANYIDHRPQSVTDAAGQTTTMTYNAAGQVLTVTNAKLETTTSAYDTDGRLQSVSGPIAGATTSYTYDAYGRVRTVTDSDGAIITTDYDLFDRPIRVTYPDGTYQETTYDRLDVATRRDRAERITRYYHDALRRLTSTRDPLGRVLRQDWCTCGSLEALVDANGGRTTWERRVDGRVTREVRADGVTAALYTYGAASGRLLTVTDPKGQVTTHTYSLDDMLLGTVFTNATIGTPSVSYTYDANYARVVSMVDGTGTTTYTYHPVGGLGAGQLASVDGPLVDDTLTYSYDALGRVTTRTINGAANTVTWTFDNFGRVATEINVLGTFTYTYDGPTTRLATVTYPNNQTSQYSYFPNSGDHTLQTIHHKYPDATTLSQFDYTYDAVGNVLTWRQQADATAVQWSYEYDLGDQLTAAFKRSTDAAPVMLSRYAYAYDGAGNRTTEQIDDAVSGATHDALNRLVSQTAAGALRLEGMTSEPATVTVGGKPLTVSGTNTFAGSIPVVNGTTAFALTARDLSGNTATQHYEVDTTGSGRTFTYDETGNLTSDGTRTFEWNAQNQVVSITVGVERREFTYDGRHRRVTERTRVSGTLVEDVQLVMCGPDICQERHSGNRRRDVYEYGERFEGVNLFYTKDHLGSLTELLDSIGTVRARNRYDPFGRQQSVGDVAPRFGFSGHVYIATDGLNLTYFRGYDPALGRWISSDPLGWRAGPNFYAYVEGRPTTLIDPFGLQSVQCKLCNPSEASQAQAAVKGTCNNVAGDKRCRQVLSQYQLLDCFQKKCSSSISVVCVPKEGSCGGCAGPCNSVSDPTKAIFIQPNGFRGPCGSLTDTVAHEMGHMCGIGPDVGNEPTRRDNRRKATDVGLACSGSQ